jgi:hypothetical protein
LCQSGLVECAALPFPHPQGEKAELEQRVQGEQGQRECEKQRLLEQLGEERQKSSQLEVSASADLVLLLVLVL